MERERIYSELTDCIPDISRRACTPRVMADVDLLLDALIEIQIAEELESIT